MLMLFSSCSHIEYTSTGKVKLNLGHNPSHEKFFSIKSSRNFYFWGVRSQNKGLVELDRLLSERGLSSASSLKIHEYQSPFSFFVSLVSLGIYRPIDIKVSGYGPQTI